MDEHALQNSKPKAKQIWEILFLLYLQVENNLKGFVKTLAMTDYILSCSHKPSRPIVKPCAKVSLKNRLSRSQSARSARNSIVKYSTISLPRKLQNINTQK